MAVCGCHWQPGTPLGRLGKLLTSIAQFGDVSHLNSAAMNCECRIHSWYMGSNHKDDRELRFSIGTSEANGSIMNPLEGYSCSQRQLYGCSQVVLECSAAGPCALCMKFVCSKLHQARAIFILTYACSKSCKARVEVLLELHPCV